MSRSPSARPAPSPARRRSLAAVFAIPAALAAITLIGLPVALAGDGLLAAASWLALGAPVAAVGYAWARRRR